MAKFSEVLMGREGKNGVSFSLFAFFYLVIFLVLTVFIGVINLEKELYSNLIVILPVLSLIFAFFVVYFLVDKEERREITLIKKFRPEYLFLAILLSVGMLFGLGFINLLISNFFLKLGLPVSGMEMDLSTTQNYIWYSLSFALAPAVFEELVFRGIIVRNLKGNMVIIALLSAFCFSIYHLSLTQFVYQFIYGFFLTVLRVKSGSLIPSTLAHFLNNFIIITTSFLKVEIDLFSPLIIGVGIVLLSVFTFFIFFYKREKTQEKSQEKIKVLEFITGGGIGIILCILIIILGYC